MAVYSNMSPGQDRNLPHTALSGFSAEPLREAFIVHPIPKQAPAQMRAPVLSQEDRKRIDKEQRKEGQRKEDTVSFQKSSQVGKQQYGLVRRDQSMKPRLPATHRARQRATLGDPACQSGGGWWGKPRRELLRTGTVEMDDARPADVVISTEHVRTDR